MLERARPVHYPDSDGTPMGENDVIVWLMASTLGTLRQWFRDAADVYVSSNSFLYFVEGDPRRRVAPDLYLVRGVPNRMRRNYKVWEEGVAPQVVFEYTTRSSRKQDLDEKFHLYRRLGVREYYVFDPGGEYLVPPFRAFRLEDGEYAELPVVGWLHSPGLELDLLARGERLRFRDPATGGELPTPDDVTTLAEELRQSREEARQEAQRAEREAARAAELGARAEELAARVRELEGRLEGLGG